jgi:hypothetical protein
MNWSRAAFRLWLGLSLVWALGWSVYALSWLIAPSLLPWGEPPPDNLAHLKPVTDPYLLAVLNGERILAALAVGLLLPAVVLVVGLFVRWVVRGLKEPVTG